MSAQIQEMFARVPGDRPTIVDQSFYCFFGLRPTDIHPQLIQFWGAVDNFFSLNLIHYLPRVHGKINPSGMTMSYNFIYPHSQDPRQDYADGCLTFKLGLEKSQYSLEVYLRCLVNDIPAEKTKTILFTDRRSLDQKLEEIWDMTEFSSLPILRL